MKRYWVPLHLWNSVEDKQSNAETPQVTFLGTNMRAGIHAFLQTCHCPLSRCCLLEALELQHALSCKTSHCAECTSQRGERARWHWSAMLDQEGISSFERSKLETVYRQQQNFHWIQMEVLLWTKHLTHRGAEPRASWGWERSAARYLCSPLLIEVTKRYRLHQQNYCSGQITSLKHFKWTKN